MLRALLLLAATTAALRVPTRRSGAVRMGLGIGDIFPAPALKQFGVAGKTAVIFFYGADDAPSCKKEIATFDEFMDDFKKLGATVVGVRNPAGAKGAEEAYPSMRIVVDDGDAVRKEVGIEGDLFGLLGGRETYVVNNKGEVVAVHNNQFGPETHISTALDALDAMPAPAPAFQLPDLSALFSKN